MRRLAIFLSLIVATGSCKRAPAPPPTTAIAAPVRKVVKIESITQLLPNRTVHLAVDSLRNVFYTMETDSGHDGVVVVGESGIPRATQLTSENILAALGETIGGSGTIQDIIAGPNGSILFYFVGGKGKKIRACVGQYQLRDESISILFPTENLAEQSGMGQSIELARGKLIAAGRKIYLFIRNSDIAAVLSFDARGFESPTPALSRALPAILIDDQTIDLTRDQFDLFGGWGDSLLLLDKAEGQLLQVDPKTGAPKARINLAGLPRGMSTPVVGKENHLTIFAADSEVIETGDLSNRNLPHTAYPALLDIAGNEISAIGRDDLQVYGGFPTYAMRIPELIAAADGSLIGYDSSSGLLMRLRIANE